MKWKTEPWVHLGEECFRQRGRKVQRPWGRNVLSILQNQEVIQWGWRVVGTRKSGRWMKETYQSPGHALECFDTSWWFHTCLSRFSDETDNLLNQWSRAVRTVVSSIRRIWVSAKLTTLYHLGKDSYSLSLIFVLYKIEIIIVPISLDFLWKWNEIIWVKRRVLSKCSIH